MVGRTVTLDHRVARSTIARTLKEVARNLTAHDDGFLRGKSYLILDRDSKLSAEFCRILQDAGVAAVRTAFQAPNMNAIAERWVLSIKSECLDRMVPVR